MLERNYMLRVKMSDDERRMLEALAHRQGLTASDVVRQLIRRDYEAKAEPPKPNAAATAMKGATPGT